MEKDGGVVGDIKEKLKADLLGCLLRVQASDNSGDFIWPYAWAVHTLVAVAIVHG